MPVPQRPRTPIIQPPTKPQPIPSAEDMADLVPELEPEQVGDPKPAVTQPQITRTFNTAIDNEAWVATCAALGYEPKILGVADPELDAAFAKWNKARDALRKAAFPEGPVMVTPDFHALVDAKTEELKAQSQS